MNNLQTKLTGSKHWIKLRIPEHLKSSVMQEEREAYLERFIFKLLETVDDMVAHTLETDTLNTGELLQLINTNFERVNPDE